MIDVGVKYPFSKYFEDFSLFSFIFCFQNSQFLNRNFPSTQNNHLKNPPQTDNFYLAFSYFYTSQAVLN